MSRQILHALKQSTTFVSGTALSRACGITRAAVWKRIKALRKKGFIIEAASSRGYRLVSAPDLSEEEIRAGLQGRLWKRVVLEGSVDSTNTCASSMIAAQMPASGTVIVADRQTGGRGRLGRRWISPGGVNVYMSMILRPEIEPRHAPFLTMLAAVAAASAVSRVSGLDVQLKWPNDLMVRGKKVGGILTEVRSEPDRITSAIIGIGINVNMAAGDFPDEISETATSLFIAGGRHHSRSRIISEVLNDVEYTYREFLQKGRGYLLQQWRHRNCTLGRKVKVVTGNETVKGLAMDIDGDGMLIVRMAGGSTKKISAGDVTFLR